MKKTEMKNRMPIESYDKIAFDLTFTNPKTSMGAGVFFVELSKHSLVRLIMRCGHEVKTPSDLWKFLQRITRQLLFAAIELSRYNSGVNDEGYTLDEYKAIANGLSPQTQQYIIIDGFYIPLSYTIKPNIFGGVSRVVTVKTFMLLPARSRINPPDAVILFTVRSVLSVTA